MSATMTTMELRFADYLFPNQLMEEDLIKIDEQYVTVGSITETKDGYLLICLDDFNDEVEVFVTDEQKIEWYVFIEEDDD